LPLPHYISSYFRGINKHVLPRKAHIQVDTLHGGTLTTPPRINHNPDADMELNGFELFALLLGSSLFGIIVSVWSMVNILIKALNAQYLILI
jgi:hypothetical protein